MDNSLLHLSDIAQAITPELLPGESLLWSGQPSKAVVFHSSDWVHIPFAIFWSGFTIFWEFGATGFGKASGPHGVTLDFFALWGVPFIVVGQYMLWGRFIYTAWRKERTIYALTNRRVMNIGLVRGRKVIDGYLATLGSITITERPDGIGTIDLSSDQSEYSGWNAGRRSRNNQMGIDLSRLAFYDIPNVRQVYQMIQAQRDRLQHNS